MRQIATNAGPEGSIVVPKVKEMKSDEGFNAATEGYEDLVKAGVIDPAKVVRSALQNAVVDRVAAAHDRSADLRDSRGEEGRAADAGRRRHGRDVLELTAGRTPGCGVFRGCRHFGAAALFCLRR